MTRTADIKDVNRPHYPNNLIIRFAFPNNDNIHSYEYNGKRKTLNLRATFMLKRYQIKTLFVNKKESQIFFNHTERGCHLTPGNLAKLLTTNLIKTQHSAIRQRMYIEGKRTTKGKQHNSNRIRTLLTILQKVKLVRLDVPVQLQRIRFDTPLSRGCRTGEYHVCYRFQGTRREIRALALLLPAER